MKLIYALALPLLFSCASEKIKQSQIQIFEKEKVCSSKSLKYLGHKEVLKRLIPEGIKQKEIAEKMKTLDPIVKACYQQEMGRLNENLSFNLCLVVGYNQKKLEYFEFSTSEIQMSEEFKLCLKEAKLKPEIQGFKNLVVVQPFRLVPNLFK